MPTSDATTHSPVSAPDSGSRWQRALVLVGIVVLAFNLRPAAVSVGPLLDEVTDGLDMNGTQTALLTSLPVLCFASVGAAAPRLGQWFGLHRSVFVGLLAIAVGLFARAHVDGVAAFLVLSFLALAGMAASNVLLPSLVKLHFPDRVGQVTALYSTALAVGITVASTLSVPIGEHHRIDGAIDWRRGLITWAFTAAIAALPWIGLLRHDSHRVEGGSVAIRGRAVVRTRLGWAMALFFGLQSLQAYAIFGWFADIFRDSGFSAHGAGLLLGVVTGIAIPLSWAVPQLAARLTNPSPLLTALIACYLLGYGGMLIAPHAGAIAWALLIGTGTTTFPMVLTLIGLRARTSAGTAALSGFAQSVGYLIAFIGPFGVGVLHDATDGWKVPILALLLLCLPQYAAGLVVCKPRYLEDELESSGAGRSADS